MSPNQPIRVMIVEDDPAMRVLLQSLLSPEGYELILAESGEEAYRLSTRQPPHLIIADVGLPGMNGYDLCRKLRQNPSTRAVFILILTAHSELADKIAGFEAGADDFVVRPFNAKELSARIRTLALRSVVTAQKTPVSLHRGKVIVSFGPKGGVGKTTIAVNYAVALCQRSNQRVCLFDADLTFGDVGIHLNLPSMRGLLDLTHHIDDLDASLVEQVLVPHTSGVRVLLGPFKPEDAETVTSAHIKRVLETLRTMFDYIVVDCHATYNERTVVILEEADTLLLVVTPEIGPLKNMSLFLDVADRIGLDPKKIFIILNRSGSSVGIETDQIERALGQKISFHIVSGGRAVVASGNSGIPLVIQQPNHPFSVQVRQIADFFVAAEKQNA